jgi:hypothetical protein
VTLPASPSTNAIIQPINIEMDEREASLSAPVNTLFCVQLPATPSLFGESLLMTALTREPESAKRESTAPRSEMKAASGLPTSYVKHAKSLLTAGLIAGITPTLTRRRLGADCREGVLFSPDGDTFASADTGQEQGAAN